MVRMYHKLAGMTGTGKTEEERVREFIYARYSYPHNR
ncbi:preprotein translocase, SecA subunit, partial [Streptococcus agalactiae 515]